MDLTAYLTDHANDILLIKLSTEHQAKITPYFSLFSFLMFYIFKQNFKAFIKSK